MITINGQEVRSYSYRDLPDNTVAAPEDTRTRLGIQVGDNINIDGVVYKVEKVPLTRINWLRRQHLSQDDALFFKRLPAGATQRPSSRPPVEPPPPVAPVLPEVNEITPVDPPRTTVNGRQVVLCVGHHMLSTDVSNNYVRLPAAARAALGVELNGPITINGQNYTVHQVMTRDLSALSEFGVDIPPSEVIFMHPHCLLEEHQVFDVRQTTGRPIPPATAEEVIRVYREALHTVMGEDITQDVELAFTPQNGALAITMRYIPGIEIAATVPLSLSARLTDLASSMREQLQNMRGRIEDFNNRLTNV